MKQIALLRNQSKAHGGELMKTRKGRAHPRPLTTNETMHLVLRSSKAQGSWSFRQPKNARRIQDLTARFARKYGVKIIHAANVGNHLHFHIKLSNRQTYRPFIRALTSAIAMAITGASRWKPLKKSARDRFWDYRPFTRVVQSYRALLNLRDYIFINQLEGQGYRRNEAQVFVRLDWDMARGAG